ncbi:MAG: prepilin peptidase, partial [Clostridiales bacterium]
MEALIYILFFIYGLLIGSFLNVCIYRIPLGISVAKGRSMCPSCHNKLGFWDLIPLFSYLFLGGHCRYCQAKISPRYAVVELLTALVFTACYWHFQALPQGILACLLAAVLIVIAFIDLDTREIPDKFHLMILFLAVINLFIDPSGDLIMKISGLFAVSVPMFVIAFFTGGFGGADIKLMAAAGLYLGTFPIIVAF